MIDCVLDASVCLLQLARPPNDRGDLARRLVPEIQLRYRLVAPALLAWETIHVVHQKRAKEFANLDARTMAVRLALEDIALDVPDSQAHARTGAFAEKLGITAYDASYLELAGRSGDGILLTEDAKLLAAARRELGKDRAHDLASLDATFG